MQFPVLDFELDQYGFEPFEFLSSAIASTATLVWYASVSLSVCVCSSVCSSVYGSEPFILSSAIISSCDVGFCILHLYHFPHDTSVPSSSFS